MPADSRAALKHLISALALGDGFQFHIVVSQSPRQIRQLLATLAEAVPARRGGSLRSEHLAPYDILPRDAPLDGAALAALVTTHLDAFPAPTAAERLVFALDATFTGEADIPAWRLLFRRMNEQRNALARRLDAALLLCLSPRLEAAFAQEAPDFWSLRGVSITLEAETTAADASPALQVPTVERMPANMEAGDEAAGRELAREVDRARQRTLAHPDELGTQRALLIWLNRLGDHLALRGHTNEALTAYREALAITEHLAHAEPERADYQREISVSYDKLGELMAALGQGEAARDFFQKALARAEPERTDHQRDLSVSYNKLGDLMAALGQGEAARDFFEKDLAISERLARAEPERADYQRDLSVSYEKLGNLMAKLGQGEAARDFFQKSLAIRERLVRAEPERADYQRDLSVSYIKLGDLMADLGQGEAARGFFDNSLAISERLTRAEPERADYQRDLSVSYNKLGDLMAALGQGEAARDFFQKSLAIFERLARAEPERADYQRDLSVSYIKLGDLMAKLGQGEAARNFFQKSLAIAERLARAEPERADYQRDLCVSYERLGDLLHKDGNIGAALDSFRQSLAIWERLVDAEPERADLQRGLVVSLTRMAQLEPDKAHAYLGRALQILRTLKSAGRQFEKLDEWIAGLEKWIEQS